MSHRHRVLIVDDSEDLSETLACLFESVGLECVRAQEGRAALGALRADPDGFCAILLDLHMPGMDGPEFRREQLADPAIAHVPVIALSADFGLMIQTARESGIALSLKKPIDPDSLVTAVRQLCAQTQADPSMN